MSIPKFYKFMKPVLENLKDNNEKTRNYLYEILSKKMNLSQEDMEELLPSGSEFKYKNRISWSLTYLKKADLIISPSRSVFRITELGHSVLKENPLEITPKYLKKFDNFKEFQRNSNEENNLMENTSKEIEENDSPQDLLDKAYATISVSLVDEILQEVMNQSPDFFEKVVVDLLIHMGYGGSKVENSKVLGKTGDEGIDGVIKEDKLGFDKIYIQAKRWNIDVTIGRPEIQKFMGALVGQGASKGAFITTAKFSKEARGYINKQLTSSIVLIDGTMLANLMIEYNIGVAIVDTYYIKRIDKDYFDDIL